MLIFGTLLYIALACGVYPFFPNIVSFLVTDQANMPALPMWHSKMHILKRPLACLV